ncbi:MAG: hypothetical protein U5K30_04385 [Acidimicrobiales bacterium]|nr:hypothetical protein [Acidimicrobiales bacterium]
MSHVPSPNTIVVTVPADTVYLRHLRVVAATVADDAGFDVERIESLRVSIDELCALAMADAADGATLTLTLGATDTAVELQGRCGPVTADPVIDPIAVQLLAAGASHHELHRDGDDCVFLLRADRPDVGASGAR